MGVAIGLPPMDAADAENAHASDRSPAWVLSQDVVDDSASVRRRLRSWYRKSGLVLLPDTQKRAQLGGYAFPVFDRQGANASHE